MFKCSPADYSMSLVNNNTSGLVGGVGAAARATPVGLVQERGLGQGPGPDLGTGPGLRRRLAALREDRKPQRKALHLGNS